LLADNFDPIVITEFRRYRGFSQVGLPVHEARGRVRELGGHAQDCRRIIGSAVLQIGRGRNRANENKGCQHRQLHPLRREVGIA